MSLRYILSLSVLWIGLLSNCFAEDPAVIQSEYIFESAPFPQCHASTIVEAKEGLVAAWFGGPREGSPSVGIWLSRMQDGHWTEPVEVANGFQTPKLRFACWNPVLFQAKDGPLLLFYKVGEEPDEWWGELKTSVDGGRTWSEARKLPKDIFGPIKNKPVQLPGGDLLCPASTETIGHLGNWRIHFERTPDLGAAWTKAEPPPAASGPEIDAIQPSILFHKDGRLQAIGRTRGHHLFETWSSDDGHTWTALKYLSLPNPNSGTDAVTLADGRHLLVYNHTASGRSPLNVAVSENGEDWQAALVLEDEPKKEFSYPAVIQSQDGLVHITYTWKRQRIKHVVLDPAKLALRPIVDGKWP